MAIVLGTKPTFFANNREVTFIDPKTDETLVINYKGKYRTATEFGALLDKAFSKAEGDATATVDATIEKILGLQIEKQAEMLRSIVHEWDAGFDLTDENALQFANELAGGVQAIVGDYRTLCVEGKAGNSKK